MSLQLIRNKRKQKNAFCLRGRQQPLRVSWLKIEPWSRFSPAIEAKLWLLLLSLQKDFSAFFYTIFTFLHWFIINLLTDSFLSKIMPPLLNALYSVSLCCLYCIFFNKLYQYVYKLYFSYVKLTWYCPQLMIY